MALQIQMDFPSGVIAEAAYLRIARIEVIHPITPDKSPYWPEYSGTTVQLICDLYLSDATRQSHKSPITSLYYTIPVDGENAFFSFSALDNKNPVSAAYIYLKSLPQFEGAIDV